MDWETNHNAIKSLWPAAHFNDAEKALYHRELSKLDQAMLAAAIPEVKKKFWADQPQLKWLLDEYAAQRDANRQSAKWKMPQPWEASRSDTFRCQTCFDTGMVRVYASQSVAAVKADKPLRRSIDLKAYRPVMFKTRDAFPEQGEDRRVHVAEDTQRAYWFALSRDSHGVIPGFKGVYMEMGGTCAKASFVCCTCQTADDRYGRWEPEPPRYNAAKYCLLPPPPYTPSAETADEDEDRIRQWLDDTGTARCGQFSAEEWAATQF
jgi:hypothetical protein